MSPSIFDTRTAERDCSAIDAMRREIATEILYKSASSRERTVIADAFVDTTIDRLIEGRALGTLDPLSAWLRTVLDRPALSPGATIVGDTCIVLEAALARAGLLGSALGAELRAVGDMALERLRVETCTVPAASIDEVDARINDLVARLESADILTAEHSRAVGSWCARLGRRLGLSDSEVTLLTRCGLLHDIGKLKVPKEILNAPRALSTAEWKVIRAHATAGENLAKKEPLLRDTLPAIRSHHERFTGGGYPDDLRGEAIPFVARVVTVADCFNAMIGRRPYRPPLAPSVALLELRQNRGTQFDPDVVDAMEEVVLHAR
ncbi:MAG TPA: HD domain-containing phosphohydrolase [Candidatus Baltobacteraceae bacterium]|jgi:putative nucleotidyltransferase with HDIG domain|nr:HD domain-containing phosphohydrolase [Candidatus Baltobacteraceae bacterium]